MVKLNKNNYFLHPINCLVHNFISHFSIDFDEKSMKKRKYFSETNKEDEKLE
jgi:hypothetical protein